ARLGDRGDLVYAELLGDLLDVLDQVDRRLQVLRRLEAGETAQGLAVETTDHGHRVRIQRRTETVGFHISTQPVRTGEGELTAGGYDIDHHFARAAFVDQAHGGDVDQVVGQRRCQLDDVLDCHAAEILEHRVGFVPEVLERGPVEGRQVCRCLEGRLPHR